MISRFSLSWKDNVVPVEVPPRGFWIVLLCCLLFVASGCAEDRASAAPNEVVEDPPAVVENVTATTGPELAAPRQTQVEAEASAVEVPASEPQTAVGDAQPQGLPPHPSVDTRLPLSRTVNVLVLGSDRRPNMPNWRTDVIMIVAMDVSRGEAGVISLPRDVYLEEIPNHRPNRINVVDYLGEQDEPNGGGPELLASIIEEKIGIPIHHYLRFDFEGFKKVVDALDGLEITLDCPVRDYLPEEDIAIRLQPGVHRLTGKQALAYVRSRAQGGDLERSRRQQRVLWAVRDQIRRENLISRVPALYTALHKSVQTDIGLVSAIRYVRFALALDEGDVHGFVISPPDLIKEGWRGGMFVFVADWERIAEEAQAIFDRPDFLESSTADNGANSLRCPG